VKGFIESCRNASAIRFGWLDNFFNARHSRNAIEVMKLSRPKVCRVHIINGPGMNNGRTLPHEITHGYNNTTLTKAIERREREFMAKFRERLQKVHEVASKAPTGTLELYISPWLEHGETTQRAFDILADEVRAEFGAEAAIVDNPVSGNFFPGYLKEKHGEPNPKGLDFVDLDGIDIEAVEGWDWGRRYEQCKVAFGWGLTENGNSKEGPWLPPHKRTNWPTRREHQIYNYFLRPEAMDINSPLLGDDVKGAKRINSTNDGYKRDFVWKLGDGRNYAVVLFPKEFNKQFKAVYIKKGGKIVDRARYRGRYTEDGSNRLIYDFTQHTSKYVDNSVLWADSDVWVLQKPQFRLD
jgi:hypothetical protein